MAAFLALLAAVFLALAAALQQRGQFALAHRGSAVEGVGGLVRLFAVPIWLLGTVVLLLGYAMQGPRWIAAGSSLPLSFWAGLAARSAGLRGRSLALSVLGGLVVSMIVLLLQVLLQPGQPVRDEGAAPPCAAGNHPMWGMRCQGRFAMLGAAALRGPMGAAMARC